MKERNSELDQLFLEVGTYRDATDYMELLKFVRRFRKMKPYNAMLLHVQKPGSTFVASASDWWKQFQRKPKPDARPLVILRPFGPVAFVYELSDDEIIRGDVPMTKEEVRALSIRKLGLTKDSILFDVEGERSARL